MRNGRDDDENHHRRQQRCSQSWQPTHEAP
jgi:hypothetical protein